MAESPENKNSENTLFMRLPAVFLTIRGNKKEKNQKRSGHRFDIHSYTARGLRYLQRISTVIFVHGAVLRYEGLRYFFITVE